MRPDIIPVLEVQNNGHAMVAFVNGEYIGKSEVCYTYMLLDSCVLVLLNNI